MLAGVVAVFTLLAIYKLDGFHDDVNEMTAHGDDWLRYKLLALDILDGGWTMPIVQGNYFIPAGFLYNYFVAAVFAATERNSAYVYLVQAVFLGLSVGVLTLAFRPYLLPSTQYLLAICLAVTSYLDVFRNYTFRLLSENLLLFWLAVFWCGLVICLRRPGNWALALGCGVVFGLCGLTRPNLIPFAPIFALVMWKAPRGFTGRQAAVFLLGFVACTSLMVARNYVVTRQLSLPAVTQTRGWVRPRIGPVDGGTFSHAVHAAAVVGAFYARRVLFSIGFLSQLNPAFHFRPHWLLAWIGVAAFVAMKIRSLDAWEILVLTFVAGYLAPLIAVAGIQNYGFRMIFPVVPFVILLAVRAVDLRLRRLTEKCLHV